MCIHACAYERKHLTLTHQAPHGRTWPGVSLDNLFITKWADVGFVSGTGVGQVGGHGS